MSDNSWAYPQFGEQHPDEDPLPNKLPLLAELDIHPKLVARKMRAICLFRQSPHFKQEPEFSGPMILLTIMALLMATQKKNYFGFVYGF